MWIHSFSLYVTRISVEPLLELPTYCGGGVWVPWKGLSVPSSTGPTTHRRSQRSWVQCTIGAMLSGAEAPGRISQGKLVLGEGSDKGQFRRPLMEKLNKHTCTLLGGVPGPHPGARPGEGACRWVPGGQAFTQGAHLGTAWNRDMGPSPSGPTTCRRNQRSRVQCRMGSRWRRGLGHPDPWLRILALGTWNVTSLVGKVPELVQEAERHRLDIIGLTYTHSVGSVTKLLERGWTLSFSRVPQGKRHQAGVKILTSPWLSAAM